MRLMDFIVEGFKEVEAKFVASGADQQTVKDTIQKYRDLVNKNQIQGSERNIDWWGKNKTFQDFAQFIELKSVVPTKTQTKRSKNVGRSITLHEDDNWLVVVPLDKDASCFHGKNSDWCTTKRSQPQFKEYFHDKNIILIYCLNKQTGGMWAIANYRNVYEPEPEEDDDSNTIDPIDFPVDASGKTVDYELFDQQDNKLTPEQFTQQTGLDPFNLMSLSDAQARFKEPIHQAQRAYQDQRNQTYRKIRLAIRRDPEIEKNLLVIDEPGYSLEYIKKLASRKIDVADLPEKILLSAASQESRSESILKYFPNAPEEIQRQSIPKQRTAIKDMIAGGVLPSTKLLLSLDPWTIAFGDNAIQELKEHDLITPELKKHLSANDYAIEKMLEQGIDFSPKEIENILTTPKNPKTVMSVASDRMATKFISQYGIWPSDAAFKNIALSQSFYDSATRAPKLYFKSPDEAKASVIDKLKNLVKDQNESIQKKFVTIKQWQEEKEIQSQKADELEKEIGTGTVFGNYRKKDELAGYQRSASMYQDWINEGMQSVKELTNTNKRILDVLRKHVK